MDWKKTNFTSHWFTSIEHIFLRLFKLLTALDNRIISRGISLDNHMKSIFIFLQIFIFFNRHQITQACAQSTSPIHIICPHNTQRILQNY